MATMPPMPSVSPYQRAFHWVRLTVLDHGTCELTPDQAGQAAGVGRDVARQVLEDLTRAGFLQRGRQDRYVRALDRDASR